MMRRAWLLIAIAAGIPAAAAQERLPAWMAACPPLCDPTTLFGNAPTTVPVEKKKSNSPLSGGENSPGASDEKSTRGRSPLPAGRGGSAKDVPAEPVLERPTSALRTERDQASPVPARSDPPRPSGPAELERPTEALKVPLPPRKPAAVPEPKRRSPEKKEIAAAPAAAPLAKKAAPKSGKKGRDSLIKPVEPIFDPRYPADAMVKTPFGMTDMTRDGFEIKAFDSRNRVLLQKGSAIALCRFDSVELPVTGGSYVGNSECYVTQRPIRP